MFIQLPVLGGRGQERGKWACSKHCMGRFLPRLVQGWVLGSLPQGLAMGPEGRTRGAVWAQTRRAATTLCFFLALEGM